MIPLRSCVRVSVLLGLALALAGCRAASLPVAPKVGVDGQAPGGVSTKGVTFTVVVDARAFSNKRQITVSLTDLDGGGPPEETILSRDELAAGLTIVSKHVTVGERYAVGVSGQASDDCNQASGRVQGVAGAERVRVADIPVMQTERACAPTRGQ